MLRRVSPANGYCLFFPNRRPGDRFVSGKGVWVWPLEQWKHVKLGLFTVTLPGDQEILITTKEKLECDVKSSFGIVVGTPPDNWKEREVWMERATVSCPPKRSLAPEDRVELVPFFRDWAANHCRMALLNAIGQSEYVRLFEDAEYRAQVQNDVHQAASSTLSGIGLLLVQCTVIITPREPSGVFATPEILDKWRVYKEAIYTEVAKKRLADYKHEEEMKTLDIAHAKISASMEEQRRRNDADLKQETDFHLRALALDLIKKEAAIAIDEQQEANAKDKKLGVIIEEMNARAQEARRIRIGREAEIDRLEREKTAEGETDRFESERLQAARRGLLADEERVSDHLKT